ncbi:MAG TPA: DUF6049 family protein [Acidimicrobiia bacterium]|nr:DUF6049 family protein [Acidimicrobiia bacterium]
MRRVGALVAVAAATVVLGAVPAWAGVQPPSSTTPAQSNAPGLVLTGQPAWVPVGGTLPLRLQVRGMAAGTPGLTVSATAHEAVGSRSAFESALAGRNLGSVLGQAELPLDLFPAGEDGSRTLTFPLQAEDAPRDPNRLQLRRTGVYPVEVELRQPDGTRLAGFVTPVVAVVPGANGGPAIGKRLGVSWVVPMVAQPAYQADGKPDPDVVDELRPDGRLGRLAVALANADVPLTLAPGPETLEAWTQLANDDPGLSTSLNAFRDALGRSQVLSGPYVPVDVRSLVGGGLSAEVGSELVQGTERLSAALGTRVDPRTEVARPANDASLARMRDAGVDRLILDGADVAPRDDQFTPAQPFAVRSQQGIATAVGSDVGLQRLLDGDDPPALRAQRFLAGLSVVALEQPNVTRGVVVLEPDDWDASNALLESTLAGLSTDHPLLQPMTVDDLIATVPPASSGNTPVERQLAPSPVPPPPVTEREHTDAQNELAAFNTLVPPPNPVADPGNHSLLVSLSSAWTGTAGRTRARAELGKIHADVQQFVNRLRVPAVDSTITLTAEKGEIPVTFLNETGQQLRVRVHLQSDKLQFPDGDERILDLPPRSTTVRFSVQAQNSGTFPLTLKVTSPDGALPIQQTEVQVRTTFFVSNVGLILTVGAGLFLAGWWAHDVRRRRRRRAATPAHPVLASPPAPADTGQSSGQSSTP